MNEYSALIIEDDQKLAMIFAEALRAAEFTPEIIRNGEEALAQLGDLKPYVIVLDLHLPYVSGKDILHKIRSDERLKHTRVIVATADPILAESLQADADLVLIKPISFGQLRDLAARLRPPDTITE